MSERLQKFLSRAGVASRRAAEELIQQGRVSVNNKVIRELGTKVTPGKDLVMVDGRLVELPEANAYLILYKPPGVVTTLDDPQGRPTVGEYLKEVGQRVYPIGRLDFDAEGALLLTDDGDLAHTLTHPSFQIPRTYLVKVKGTPTSASLERLVEGVRLEDGQARATVAEVFEQAERNTWVRLVVTEGRQHLVKRLCAAIGHPVMRLFRPAHAGIPVQGMRPGEVRRLTGVELERVKALAAGQKVPEPALTLPARRHGHGAPSPGGRPDAGEEDEVLSAPPGRSGKMPPGRARPGGAKPAYGERTAGAGRAGGGKKPYADRSGRAFGKASAFAGAARSGGAKKPYGKPAYKKPYGESAEGAGKPAFAGRAAGAQKPYGKSAEGGGKPAFAGRAAGAQKPYGKSAEEGGKPAFTGRAAGAKKPYGKSAEGGGKPAFAGRAAGARKPYGKPSYQSSDREAVARKTYGEAPTPTFGARAGAGPKKPFGERTAPAGGKPPYDRAGSAKKPYGKPAFEGGARKPFGKPAYEGAGPRKPHGKPAYEGAGPRKPYGKPAFEGGARAGGARKPFGERPGPSGGKPPYAARAGGAKKPYGARPAGAKPGGGPRPGRPSGPRGGKKA